MQLTISNRRNLLFFTLFLLFVGIQKQYAQPAGNEPLLSILEKLELQHNVRFSYATKDISGLLLLPPEETMTLTESLQYLNRQTSLNFTQISERYITVIADDESSPPLCARLLDSETGTPLEGATILSKNGTFATTSQKDGIFYVPGELQEPNLSITYVGYNPLLIPLSELKNECPAILMIPEIAALEPIYIKPFLVQGITKEVDGAITIKTNNFGLLPGQVGNDVLLIAQALPGVESVDETTSTINIRGGTHNENLILWDHIRMYQSGHFFGMISAFNPDITKEVTIYKNGTPAVYGEGVSGVIDMRSNNSIPSSIEGGVGFNLISANVFAAIPLSEKLGIQVSGRNSLNKLVETPVYKSYANRIFQDTKIRNNLRDATIITADEDFGFFDFSTKILWEPSQNDSFRVNFLMIDNTLDFTETIATVQLSKTSELQQQSLVGGISWKHVFNSMLQTNVQAYGTFYKLDALNRDILTTQVLLQENEVLETGVKLDAVIKLSEVNTLQAGYHFSETGIANLQDVNLPRFRNYEKEVLRSHIVYGSLKYSPNGEKTVIQGGVRLNYYTKFDKILVEPRLSIHQKIGNGFAIEGLGEFKSQTTTQRIDFESDFLGIEKRRWILVNDEDIPIIKSKQVSFGIVYDKRNWFINAEGFYKNVDGITTTSQGFQNQFEDVQSSGEYWALGAEVVLNKKFTNFSGWLSYIYLNNHYKFSELSLADFQNNLDLHHTINLAGSYTWKKFKFALGTNYHTGKPFTLALGYNEENESIAYEAPNKKRVPDYFRTDFSAEYAWNISDALDAKINLAVLNLLNNRNILDIRYALVTNQEGVTEVNQVEELSLGITPNFSFQLLF